MQGGRLARSGDVESSRPRGAAFIGKDRRRVVAAAVTSKALTFGGSGQIWCYYYLVAERALHPSALASVVTLAIVAIASISASVARGPLNLPCCDCERASRSEKFFAGSHGAQDEKLIVMGFN